MIISFLKKNLVVRGMEKLENVYIKKTRKFHDAWAFVLYLIVYITCTTLIIMNFKEKSVDLKFLYEEIYHFVKCLVFVVFFTFTIFCGLYYIPVVYLKTHICIFPIIVIYLALKYDNRNSFWSALSSIFVWGLFTSICWSKLYIIGGLLQIVVKIMLKNTSSVLIGTILCSILQILQIFLAIRSKFWMFSPNLYVFILFMFNIYWTTANINYFFKVFYTSIVAFHFINKGDAKMATLKESFKNTLYALGSISFAGFIIALIYTARMLAKEEEDKHYSKRNNTLEYLLLWLLSRFLGVVIDVMEISHDLTLPYMAIHGESYVNSIKGAYEIYTKSIIPLGGLFSLNYTFFLTSLMLFLGFYKIFTNTMQSIHETLRSDRFIRVLGLTCLPLVFYFNITSNILSSYLGLIYFKIENSELVKENYPEIEDLYKSTSLALET